MSKPSRRRRTARTAARAPTPPAPADSSCMVPGCDNPRDFSCGTCDNALCSACIVPMSRVMLCNREAKDWEVCFSCPFCRKQVAVCLFADFAEDSVCTFKGILAKANVRTLKLPSFCRGCNGDAEVIIDHVACDAGCYGCAHSKIDFMLKQ